MSFFLSPLLARAVLFAQWGLVARVTHNGRVGEVRRAPFWLKMFQFKVKTDLKTKINLFELRAEHVLHVLHNCRVGCF